MNDNGLSKDKAQPRDTTNNGIPVIKGGGFMLDPIKPHNATTAINLQSPPPTKKWTINRDEELRPFNVFFILIFRFMLINVDEVGRILLS